MVCRIEFCPIETSQQFVGGDRQVADAQPGRVPVGVRDGGVLTDAKEIVDKIMRFKKPVWVFINSDAASAGALISIACDSIYMSPGSNIGAATVVGADGAAAPGKYQSYMRSIMRSTAEANGRDPHMAEAMVEASVDSTLSAGQVLTLTTTEAIKYGFCDGVAVDVDVAGEGVVVADAADGAEFVAWLAGWPVRWLVS